MTGDSDEAEALEVLMSERDRCARGVLEFMAACGVRCSTMPPRLLELLTVYGFKATDIGRALAHEPSAEPGAERVAPLPSGVSDSGDSGVRVLDADPFPWADPEEVTRAGQPSAARRRSA